ncbi:uncharacterized protein LOC144432782 [Glandiceps talaboti]
MADEKSETSSPDKQKEPKEVSFAKNTTKMSATDAEDEAKSRPSTRQSQKSNTSIPLSDVSDGTLRRKFLASGNLPTQSPTSTEMRFRKRKKKGRKSKTPSHFDDDEEREAKRLEELQEKHMQIFEDLTKLRNHYYYEYMTALNEKVHQQRKDIQKKTDELYKKIAEKEEKEKADSHHVKKRHEKSKLFHDNSHLKNLPKTHYYRIVELQDKKIKEGDLKTQTDVDNFWEDIQKPDVFRETFGLQESVISESQLDSPSSASLSSTHSMASLKGPDTTGGSFVPMVKIQEDKEPSRPSTKGKSVHQWAVTQQFSKKNNNHQQGYLSAGAKGRRTSVHPKALALDQQFPRVALPPLAAFTLDLEPRKDDPEIERMNEEFRIRSRIRDRERRRLRLMYEYALTHQAATLRILEKKEDYAWMTEGPSIGDLINVFDQKPSQPLSLPEVPELSLPAIEDGTVGSDPILPSTLGSGSRPGPLSAIEELSEHRSVYSLMSRDSTKKSLRSEGSIGSTKSAGSRHSRHSSGKRSIKSNVGTGSEPEIAPRPPSRPLPLTMDSIVDDCTIREAKCLSTLWTNYTKDQDIAT